MGLVATSLINKTGARRLDSIYHIVCFFDSLRPINNLSVKQGLPGLNLY